MPIKYRVDTLLFRVPAVLIFSLLFFLMAACSGGGSGEENTIKGSDHGNQDPPNVTGRVALGGVSFAGAKVQLGSLDISRPDVQQAYQIKLGKLEDVVIVSVADPGDVTVYEDNSIQFNVEKSKIEASKLYVLTITCDLSQTSCEVENPLHAVMTGSQLLSKNWSVNLLTEAAYQKLSYYLATRFDTALVQQEMDSISSILLKKDLDGSGAVSYNDILHWNGSEEELTTTIKRPAAYKIVHQQLLSGRADVNAVKLAVQKLTSAEVVKAATEYQMHKIAVEGNRAYVLESRSSEYRLAVYDVENDVPTIVTSLTLPEAGDDLYLSDGLILVRMPSSGLWVVDVSNADVPPVLLGSYDLGTRTAGLAVYKNYAFVILAGDDNVEVIDFRNPRLPSRAHLSGSAIFNGSSTIDSKATNAVQLIVKGDQLFVRDNVAKLEVYRLTALENELRVDRAAAWSPPGRYYVDAMAVKDEYVYLGLTEDNPSGAPKTIRAQLAILKTDSQGNLEFIRQLPFEFKINAITVFGERAFVDTSLSLIKQTSLGFPYMVDKNLVQLYDLTNPEEPAFTFNVPVSDMEGLALQDDGLYTVRGSSGMLVFDVAAMIKPPIDKFASVVSSIDGHLVGGASGVDVVGSNGFLCSAGKLKVFSLEQGMAKKWGGELETNGSAFKVAVNNSMLYVLNLRSNENTKVSSIDMFQAGQSSHVETMGSLLLKGFAENIRISDKVAYIPLGDKGIQMLNLTNGAPEELDALPVGNVRAWARDIAVNNKHVFVANGADGLNIQNIGDLAADTFVARQDVKGTAMKIANYKNAVYIASTDNEASIQIFDVRDPANPRKMPKDLKLGGNVTAMHVRGHYLYAGTPWALYVIDVSNPISPVLMGDMRTMGEVADIKENGGLLYMATSFGLETGPAVPAN